MFSLFLKDAWTVLIYSVLLGAGLPVVYAVGVRALALGQTGEGVATDGVPARRSPLGVTLATICFAVVVLAVAVGLLFIIASGHGDKLSFEHGYPTFVPK